MDGAPNGRIKCSLTNWIGVVYSIPRTDLPKCKDRPDLNQTGVYILFGGDDEHSEELVYVGQARERKNGAGVLGRIVEHIGEEKLDYFTHALAIITSNDSFGATEISYLENAFYNQALAAGRVRVTNGNDPSSGKVTEEKQAELDEFISYAKIAIGSLGFRLFDSVDDAKSTASSGATRLESDGEPLLYLDAAEAKGTGRQTADGFVVLAGSRLRPQGAQSIPKRAKANREKYADRLSDDFVLTQDTLFTSPSAASDFLMGVSSSGKLYWKNDQGISLGELEKRELEELDT
ncbi:MAG: GIY-YIG nuclease family protein [Bowdeniella nasicola]|nr:GIY-YIG nuclease family protein [Bowdeniella nasicola]